LEDFKSTVSQIRFSIGCSEGLSADSVI